METIDEIYYGDIVDEQVANYLYWWYFYELVNTNHKCNIHNYYVVICMAMG